MPLPWFWRVKLPIHSCLPCFHMLTVQQLDKQTPRWLRRVWACFFELRVCFRGGTLCLVGQWARAMGGSGSGKVLITSGVVSPKGKNGIVQSQDLIYNKEIQFHALYLWEANLDHPCVTSDSWSTQDSFDSEVGQVCISCPSFFECFVHIRALLQVKAHEPGIFPAHL